SGDDGTVRLYDLKRRVFLRQYNGQQSTIYDATVTSSGYVVSIGRADRGATSLIWWNLYTGAIERRVMLELENLRAATFLADGAVVLTSEGEEKPVRWRSFNSISGVLIDEFTGETGWTDFIEVSPDFDFALSGGELTDSQLHLWSLREKSL